MLHTQLNTLDSIWAFEVKAKNKAPIRFIALGRDAASVSEGVDNEPTGIFVSNGRRSCIRGPFSRSSMATTTSTRSCTVRKREFQAAIDSDPPHSRPSPPLGEPGLFLGVVCVDNSRPQPIESLVWPKSLKDPA
jgi:hypothetical protein